MPNRQLGDSGQVFNRQEELGDTGQMPNRQEASTPRRRGSCHTTPSPAG
ncbi:MAG: hypothetical protein RBU37_10770 [Myxococcota bacterium]|nr:hypothetical protein [Myxococcota bacterium]